MNNVKGRIIPLRDNVFVHNMEFGEQQTASGIVVTSDDGKTSGIHPRWGQVWAVGPEQTDLKIGEWVLVEHGRWTRTIKHEADDGTITELRMIDNTSIIMSTDERPNDVERVVLGVTDLRV